MKNVLLIAIALIFATSSFCQKTNNSYPKPFQIDYGTRKSDLKLKMKAKGFSPNKEFKGLVYEPICFMGHCNADASFGFDINDRMMNCEVFCNFESMISAYVWYDDVINNFSIKYEGVQKTQHREFSKQYKNRKDSLLLRDILVGIKNNEITEYTEIRAKKDTNVVLIRVEITKFEAVRVSFNDLTMQLVDEKKREKRNNNDI